MVAPGLKGTGHALEVGIDGTGRRSFVEIDHGFSRDSFSASFLLDPRSVDLGDSQVEIARLTGPLHHVALVLSQERRKYLVTLLARSEGGALMPFGRTRVPRRRRP